MTMQDPIADMLTRMRNAQQAEHPDVTMMSSKQKVAIANVLKTEGYILGFDVSKDGVKQQLTIKLKYDETGQAAMDSLVRRSRPGLRIYKGAGQLDRVLGGLGIAIVSTSQGVMSGERARSVGLGGEILCWIT